MQVSLHLQADSTSLALVLQCCGQLSFFQFFSCLATLWPAADLLQTFCPRKYVLQLRLPAHIAAGEVTALSLHHRLLQGCGACLPFLNLPLASIISTSLAVNPPKRPKPIAAAPMGGLPLKQFSHTNTTESHNTLLLQMPIPATGTLR